MPTFYNKMDRDKNYPSPALSFRERTTSPTRGEVSLPIVQHHSCEQRDEIVPLDTSPLVGEVGLLRCGARAKERVRGVFIDKTHFNNKKEMRYCYV